ncbi:hypothetical protein GEMRC1_013333 [Eukaryota sp. GEM-RC1]
MVLGSEILAAFDRQRVDSAESDNEILLMSDEDPQPDVAHDSSDEQNLSSDQPKKRRSQSVITVANGIKVLKWMEQRMEQHGYSSLYAETPRHFSSLFNSNNYKANVQKISRWWKQKDTLVSEYGNTTKVVTSRQSSIRRVIRRKAFDGRGRKQAEWVAWLHNLILEEFFRHSKAGLNISKALLIEFGLEILHNSEHDVFNAGYIDPNDKQQQAISQKLNDAWIQNFVVKNNIVIRKQTGKLALTDEKSEELNKAWPRFWAIIASNHEITPTA